MLEKSAILFSNWNMIKFHYQLSTNNLVVSIFKIVDDTVITGMTENLPIIRLSNPDKYFPRHLYLCTELQISCVFAFFTLWKRVKMHVLSDQSVHVTHTYCCVSKLPKVRAYLYSRVHNNTFLSLRKSPQLLPFILKVALLDVHSVSARLWNLQDNCQFYQNFLRTFFNN